MQREFDEITYIFTTRDGSVIETLDINEAKLALREGQKVLKNTRKVFYSGPTHVRLYVTTPIKKAKEL